MTDDRMTKQAGAAKQSRHPERSRGIPWRHLKLSSRDPSTPLRSAQDDGLSVRHSCFVVDSSFVIRHSSFSS
jgi:hypothetical protein